MALVPHGVDLQTQDGDRTLQGMQYCLVLVVEYEAPDWQVDGAVLLQKTGVVLQTPPHYEQELGLSTMLQADEPLKETLQVLGESVNVILVLMRSDVPNHLKH